MLNKCITSRSLCLRVSYLLRTNCNGLPVFCAYIYTCIYILVYNINTVRNKLVIVQHYISDTPENVCSKVPIFKVSLHSSHLYLYCLPSFQFEYSFLQFVQGRSTLIYLYMKTKIYKQSRGIFKLAFLRKNYQYMINTCSLLCIVSTAVEPFQIC